MAIKQAKPDVEVIGVQAAGCAPMTESLREGRPIELDTARTIADGIAVKRPGEVTLPLLDRWLDGMVEVEDDAIVEAMVFIAERAKLITEGAGAVAVAALLTGAVEPAGEGATAAVLSGGNVDPRLLAAAINRHEMREHRRVRITTRVDDHPGGLADLLQRIAENGANILEVSHVRDRTDLDLSQTAVELLLETRGSDHIERLRGELEGAGYELGREG